MKGKRLGSKATVDPAHQYSLPCEKDCTKYVSVGSVVKENTWLTSETKAEILVKLLLEETDNVASNWRKSIIVWRLTVGILEDGLCRLIDRGGGDEAQCSATISQNRDGMFLSTMCTMIALVIRSISPIPFSSGPLPWC